MIFKVAQAIMMVGVVMCPPQVSLLCLACGGLYYDRASVYVWIRLRQLVDGYWHIWDDVVTELVDIVIYIHLLHLLFSLFYLNLSFLSKSCENYLFFFFLSVV